MKRLILILTHSVIWRSFLRFIIGVKYVNRSVLKREKQYILIANHNSHLDSMAIMSAVPMKSIHKVHPIAAQDFFGDGSTVEFLMKHFVNAVLIPRKRPKNSNDPDPLQIMSDVLDIGHSIIIYPEGTRGEPGVMQEFKKGIAMMVQRHPDIPVIPIFLDGLHRSMPKGVNLFLPSNSKLFIGEPINFSSNETELILEESLQGILEAKTH
ncbi:MAG: hypothetical protein CMB32_00390 [Euryarchaeota archaeon]|nr:hypothetical protein [Euryarchaeota archaeon]